MAASGGVRVTGLNELVRDLEGLGVDLADLKDAFGEIAAEGARLASSFAPRRRGALAGSIRGSRSKNRAVVAADGARVPYASVINYGWAAHNIRATHFMQRADDALRPRALSALEAAAGAAIRARGLQ